MGGRRASGTADGRAVPTAEMISRRAGVSKSTVSRALKGHRSIPAKTRARITAIAHELGYQPNAIARSLVTRRSGIVGFVISETENPVYEEQLEKFTKRVSQRDMQVMLFQVPPDGDLSDVVPNMLQYRLDGCIVIASVPISASAVATCARFRMPVVLLNRSASDTSACSVLCNSEAGGRKIAEFLVAGGHSRIAFIAGRENSVIARDREAGFTAGLKAAGQSVYAREIGEFTFLGGYEAARRLLARTPRPDAIFAASDIMGFAALDALRDFGLRASDDVSIVGFDDIRSAAWPAYRLTTVAQPGDAMLARALDLIATRIQDPDQPPEIIYINGELRVRRSARIPQDYVAVPDQLASGSTESSRPIQTTAPPAQKRRARSHTRSKLE